MVVKVAEYSGTLNCKNCIIVPYSSRSQSSKTVIKSNANHCGSQTISTSLFNDSKREELWHKQFSRWWTWNWQRKRASLLKKLGKTKTHVYEQKINDDHTPKKSILMKNKSIECNLTSKHKIDTKLSTNTIKTTSGRLHQANRNNYEYIQNEPGINEFIPILTKCSPQINDRYKSRKRRNKHNERIYEGWMREVSSSDTESDTNIVVKGESRKNNNRMHYLSLRLRKLNSNLINLNDDENSKKVNEYKSPVSGKTYNLKLTKTHEIHIEPNETNNLNAKSYTDKEFLARPEFPCTTEYYKIRNEHFEILNSVCQIIKNKPEENNTTNEVHNTNTSCIVELSSLEDDASFNLNSDDYKPNISRSLPIFLERNPQEIIKCDRFSDQMFRRNSSYYDINYIYNNLDVFKSSITETSFIWDYLQKKK